MKWSTRNGNHYLQIESNGIWLAIGYVIPHMTDGTYRPLLTMDNGHGAQQLGNPRSSLEEAKKAVEDRAREFAWAILGESGEVTPFFSGADSERFINRYNLYREIYPNLPPVESFSELSPGPQSL